MIRVRLEHDRWGRTREEDAFIQSVYDRYQRFSNYMADDRQQPFRDAESIRFLEKTYGMFYPDSEDRFSVVYKDTRMPLTELSPELKFGLEAIANSREGWYTRWSPASSRVWKVLADMPFDILIYVSAYKRKEMEKHYWVGEESCLTDVTVLDRGEYARGLTSGVGYQLEHCLYKGGYIDVMVKGALDKE